MKTDNKIELTQALADLIKEALNKKTAGTYKNYIMKASPSYDNGIDFEFKYRIGKRRSFNKREYYERLDAYHNWPEGAGPHYYQYLKEATGYIEGVIYDNKNAGYYNVLKIV